MAETRVHYKNDQPRQITLVYTPMVVAMIHSLYVKLGKNPVEYSNFNAESIAKTIFTILIL